MHKWHSLAARYFCALCIHCVILLHPAFAADWTAWPLPEEPPVTIRHTATPPRIDGVLDDAVWHNAAWTHTFKDMVDASAPWLRTEVALLWDATALYVAVRMQEPWLEAQITERDGMVYRDPDFELFIAGEDSYWEVEVNAAGTIYDVFWIWRDALHTHKGFDPHIWNEHHRRVMLLAGIGEHRHPRGERVGFIDADMAGMKVAVQTHGTLNDTADHDTGWTVEMAIPWAALGDLNISLPPSPEDIWRINLSRFVNSDAAGKTLPLLRPAGWTLTRHGVFDSHIPERFAFARFEKEILPTTQELATYLQQHLTPEDIATLGEGLEAFCQHHAAFITTVIQEAPWKDKLTPELIYAYILPPRVTQEPLEAWGDALRADLMPLVHTLPDAYTITDAAFATRSWLAQRVVPGQSPAWSMGPTAIMRAGAGRCEEIGILFVCALRALGIPARIAYTPVWRGMDGNHLWVEFWDGTTWVALSPEQADAPPNSGWFYPHVETAAMVLARGFGEIIPPLESKESVYTAHTQGFALQRSAAYTSTGTLRISTDMPEPFPILRVYVFNGGRPRSVAQIQNPKTVLTLGTGTYLLSIAHEGRLALRTVTIMQGQETYVQLSLADIQPFHTQYAQGVLQVQEAVGYTAPPHLPTPASFSPAQKPMPEPVDGLMYSDALYAHTPTLHQERATALAAWQSFWGVQADTAFYQDYVQSGRVEEEPFSHWRAEALRILDGSAVQGDAATTAHNMQQRIKAHFAKATAKAPGSLSLKVLWQGHIQPTARQYALLYVAGLRSLGVPARVASYTTHIREANVLWAEYFDGTTWVHLYPLDNNNLEPHIKKRMDTHYDETWTLCHITAHGSFVPVTVQYSADTAYVYAPQGEYVLVQGTRDAQGFATYTLRPVLLGTD